MNAVSYMPGCAVKTTGKNYEESALRLLEFLGVEVVELEEWFCCGTTFSLARDNLMQHLAPVRNLIRAAETGRPDLLVLCSMCYNTIARARDLIKEDKEKRDILNDFMYMEDRSIRGDEVNVVQFLTLLKERIGFDTIRERIQPPETELKAAAYYGCMLLRPKGISIDPCPDDPDIMEQILSLFGIEPVYFPFKTECCGSFQTVSQKQIVAARTGEITCSAKKNGADIIVTSCPLCYYNLDYYQSVKGESGPDSETIPVMYIAELLNILAGLDDVNDYSLHSIDPVPVLGKRGIPCGAPRP